MKHHLARLLSSITIFALLAVFALPASGVGQLVAAAAGYKDVPIEHYASKEIAKLSQMGIVEGNTEGLFQPDQEITRGVAAMWLSKAMKLDAPSGLNGFTDVLASSPYVQAVNILKEKNIVQGDQGKFGPEEFLTREQMASLLARAFQLKDNHMNIWFKDEKAISDSHIIDVVRLKQNFITEQLEFMPKNKVTRAQLVLFLNRAMALGENKENELPIQDFLKASNQSGFQPSPDGKQMAFLKAVNNQIQIFVGPIGEETSTRITTIEKRDIVGFFWFNNERLIYMTDMYGTEDYHLHSVRADGLEEQDLTPFNDVRAEFLDSISYLQGHEQDIIISLNKRSSQVFDVYRLNVKTGVMEMIAQNPGNVTRWMTDLYGDVRIAMATDGIETKMLYRRTAKDPFEPILTVKFEESFIPIMFSFDQSQLFALSNINRDKLALVKFNLNTSNMGETVYENAQADVTDIVVSYRKEAILAVKYETDKVHYAYLDKEFELLNQEIAGKLGAQSYSIIGNPLPDSKVLLMTYSDTSPGTYYYYDRSKSTLDKIADRKPWLQAYQMAEMKPISYRSRDGLTINGYLTLPKSGKANLPFVILPHGGPQARDSWGFNSEVQLLANRGYGVLQMNFRGSTGYGKEFLNAGNLQWGNAMQDDITDGVSWVTQQGYADPKRIAIYGASYGGYAALAGVTFTPDLYAAGIDYMGPSSLLSLLGTMPSYWEPDRQIMYKRVGDPQLDKQSMEARSPLLHVDRIKVPVMIAQGVNDPRVKKSESDQIVLALRQRGIDAPYMIKNDEGHGFQNFENRVDFYTALLRFLDNHLGK
ncbi:S9 family peptidase [Paenibacillus agricola]|uniref:Prolyl oligopeptidase family serine peptidase n=1 Tax=Paenibacillus agricola TaxID=2716264 RepID=A0ABX0J8P3_9BACL|nr:prolyl oligopeptidase family serine peptidase [Paenibacillus agricola]NHN31681.1 prolyl oligopeptidase family serine peptidase [Paenibacillus agricola]